MHTHLSFGNRSVDFKAAQLCRFLCAVLSLLIAPSHDSRCETFPGMDEVFEAIKDGQKLNQKQSEDLEHKLEKNPKRLTDRTRLLAYYSSRKNKEDAESARIRRAKHIHWFIQNEPRYEFHAYPLCVINSKGQPFADEAAYQHGKTLWLKQVEQNADDKKILDNAVDYLQLDDPEEAERLIKRMIQLDPVNTGYLGRVYGLAILGVTARDPMTGDPSAALADQPRSEFAKRALNEIESATQPQLVKSAALTITRSGGILYSDGNLGWDYTPIARRILQKARQTDLADLSLFAVPGEELPKRGERPPKRLRVGGNVMQKQLTKQIKPPYPLEARMKGIEGVVLLQALISEEGRVAKAIVVSGPVELQQPSLDAIMQWEYKPTLLNGRPAQVMTQITVNYSLGPPPQ